MHLHLIEAGGNGNWGKFAVGRFGEEWHWRSHVSKPYFTPERPQPPLLRETGWNYTDLFILDLQTKEGARFYYPDLRPTYQLQKHQIWVCPLFEPFLTWLYRQDLGDLSKLPGYVDLPGVPLELSGYRRSGPADLPSTSTST